MKKRKVIVNMPKAASGMDVRAQLETLKGNKGLNSNQLPWGRMVNEMSAPEIKVNNTLKPVPREEANLEAERGEVASVPGKGGIPDTFKIAGERHTNGGTPLKLPGDSFIFSDTNKMKIKDQDILDQFGMPESKGGYTPADVAKKYNVNPFKKVLADADTDPIQRKTAELMISNYNLKLAKLALIQESMKGFPQAVPAVAMPYMEAMQIDPAAFVQMNPGQGDASAAEQGGAKMGGVVDYFGTGGEKGFANREDSSNFLPKGSKYHDVYEAYLKGLQSNDPNALNAIANTILAQQERTPWYSLDINPLSDTDKMSDFAGQLKDKAEKIQSSQKYQQAMANYRNTHNQTMSKLNNISSNLSAQYNATTDPIKKMQLAADMNKLKQLQPANRVPMSSPFMAFDPVNFVKSFSPNVELSTGTNIHGYNDDELALLENLNKAYNKVPEVKNTTAKPAATPKKSIDAYSNEELEAMLKQ